MPSIPFVFEGESDTSDWLDVSIYRGMSVNKTFRMGGPTGTNLAPFQNLLVQFEVCAEPGEGDEKPTADPALPPQQGANWSFDYAGSFSKVRISFVNFPADPPEVEIDVSLGFEYVATDTTGQDLVTSGQVTAQGPGAIIVSAPIPADWNTSPGIVCGFLATSTSATVQRLKLTRTGKPDLIYSLDSELEQVLPRTSGAPGDLYRIMLDSTLASGETVTVVMAITT